MTLERRLNSVVLSVSLLCYLLLNSSTARAQMHWQQLATPGHVKKFALGSDGTLFIITGGDQITGGDSPNDSLWASMNHGSDWTLRYVGARPLAIYCDSNGRTTIVEKTTMMLSENRGISWFPITLPVQGAMAISSEALYSSDYGTNILRSQGYFGAWTPIYRDYQLADCAGIYAGAGDRVLAALELGSNWAVFDSGRFEPDSIPKLNLPFADNSPPTDVCFGRDGYIYFTWFGMALRLPAGSTRWEAYSDTSRRHWDTVHHVPFASADASTLIWLDTSRTLASHDHGSTWAQIGEGVARASYAFITAFDPFENGYILTDSALFITRSLAIVRSVRSQILPILYPNPCERTLNINSQEAVTRFEISDALGHERIVGRSDKGENLPEVDVSRLEPGVYWIAIQTTKGFVVGRFLKK